MLAMWVSAVFLFHYAGEQFFRHSPEGRSNPQYKLIVQLLFPFFPVGHMHR